MYQWYRIIPTTPITQPVSVYRDDQAEAWAISQEFVMENDIHYDMSENVWHMSLVEEDVLALTLKLPLNLKLKRLTD